MLSDGIIISEGSDILNLTIASGTTFPDTPNVGELFFKTSATIGLYYHDGVAWNIISTDADLLVHTSDTNVHLSPSQNTLLDAVTVSASEINFLNGASANIQGQINDKLNISGGTLTGSLTLNAAPVGDLDAATKKYVDDGITAATPATTLTGDVTGNGFGTVPTTLSSSGVVAGSYGDSTNVATVNADSKGRITYATNTPIAFPVTSVAGKTGAVTLTPADVGLSNISNSAQITNGGGTPEIQTGTSAAKPAAGVIGKLYLESDTHRLYRDNGTSWDLMLPAFTGDVASSAGTNTLTLNTTGVASGTYKSVTVDLKGRVTAGTNPTTLSGYGITDAATTTDLNTHISDSSVHLTSTQNTLLDGLNSNLTSAELNYVHGVTSDIQTQLDSKVSKSGSIMTGNLVFPTGTSITMTDAPVASTDVANKAYVDGLSSGLTWAAPVQLSNLVGTSTAPIASPIQPDAYIIGAGGNTGAWSTFAVGDAVQWSSGSWHKIKSVAIGDRYGVAFQNQTAPVGDFVGKLNYIATISGGTPGNWTYTWEAAVAGRAVFVNNPNAYLFGHSYTYVSGSNSWVEFSGPTATDAGVGLAYSGNTLNINLGAGIAELPSDGVGIDLHSAAGLMLTVDGVSSSSADVAQLAIKLNGSTLDRSANGLKVSAGGITAVEINSSALGSDLTGGNGTAIVLSNTGVSNGTYSSVTVDAKGRVTAGSNPSTLSAHGITDAVQNVSGVPSVSAGIFSTRPVAGASGRLFVSTDTYALYRDNGTSWDLMSPQLTGDIVKGAGSASTALSLTGVAAGTYSSVTVDTKGRVNSASNSVAITGGSIDGAAIGSVSPATGAFTTLTAITPSLSDNSTKVATTAFVQANIGSGLGSPSDPTAATFTYNGAGTVNQIVETVIGSPRTTVFTYNSDLTVHTQTVTYQSVSKVTTYTYNPDGSVASYTVA